MTRHRSDRFRFPRVQPASRIQCPTSPRSHVPKFNRCELEHPRRSGASALPTPATRPNSRAADSVRPGKADAPPAKKERFRRSETCGSGAGGTRTHGRRIMSPLRTLATLVDQCSSWPFSQPRRGLAPHPFSTLVSLFRSLCPTCVQNASPDGHAHPVQGPSPQLRRGSRNHAQRIPFPTRSDSRAGGSPPKCMGQRPVARRLRDHVGASLRARGQDGAWSGRERRPAPQLGRGSPTRPQRTPLPTARRLSPGC
jgi:hypothetical protein